MRIMGLDYGSRTVGVALTDDLMMTAQPLETITRDNEGRLRRTFARIEEIISEYSVSEIVLGLPLNMDDSESERTARTLEFRDKLEKRLGMPVHLQDERLTTVTAREILEEMGVRPQDMKKYVDKIAATIILRDYMEKGKENGR